MKHFNTRKQLVLSVLSLLLCVSMLVGSTFAWFTDSVESGMNTIAAGNLDVELYNGDVKVSEETALFNEVELWEPGMVVYENLQVRNVGNLALKYQLSLNFGNENATLAGNKLSEVLKVAIVDKIADGATRAEVLEAAKAAAPKALNQFVVTGELLPNTVADEQSVVIFWEPNADEIDNLYNLNNGQIADDGKDYLFIEFGVKLEATQMMYEDDSFGIDYDEFATILPHASVNAGPAKTVKARPFGNLNIREDLALDFTMQFLPNESYEQAQASAYRYYHADFVVKADKDVAAESIVLAGFYNAWCELIDYDWVYLTASENIPANTEVRLVGGMGAYVNYEEICLYGNDGTGFLCGAADKGGNEGTTITVELRLYETTIDPSAESGPANIETGEFITVGTYTYTF